METLWISGGAVIDPEENITRGNSRWRPAYLGQREHKMAQLDDMTRYTQSHQCRMVNLVRHFGDLEDTGRPCGICDICEPNSLTAQNLRAPDETEREILERIMEALRAADGLSTGKLFTAVLGGGSDERRQFESMLHGLSRAGLVQVRDRTFTKGEREIQFRLVELTAEGRTIEEPVAAFVTLPEERPKPARKRRAKNAAKSAKRRASSTSSKTATADAASTSLLAPGDEELFESLREWRLKEAKRKRVPAFQIMPDRVLRGIVSARPAVEDDLLDVTGIGPKLAEKYGKKILEIVRGGNGGTR
jgi:DNA topoisomerase-3